MASSLRQCAANLVDSNMSITSGIRLHLILSSCSSELFGTGRNIRTAALQSSYDIDDEEGCALLTNVALFLFEKNIYTVYTKMA
jgi:hypothetical protein